MSEFIEANDFYNPEYRKLREEIDRLKKHAEAEYTRGYLDGYEAAKKRYMTSTSYWDR